MNRLTLNDIVTYLVFLLRTRRAELDAIEPARAFAPTLDRSLAALEALPPENFGGAPNAERLAAVDAGHDGHGEALYHLALAYEVAPLASAEAKQAARLLLDSYVPSKNHLRASYATEAARAEGRQPALAEHRAVLDRLPVEGGSAHLWASAYVSAGVELSGLLSGRADATGNRTDAASLRGDAMSEVRVLRELLAKALRRTPDGGRAVDHRLFHYLDTLAAMRAGGSASPTPPAPADPPPA